MLVLSRKSSETIHVGDNIVIHVLKVRGAQVKLGIEAPGDVTILRSELTVDRCEVSLSAEPSAADRVAVDEPYDDVAAVFAHPQSNQDRTRRSSAVRALRDSSKRSATATPISMSQLASAVIAERGVGSRRVDNATAS